MSMPLPGGADANTASHPLDTPKLGTKALKLCKNLVTKALGITEETARAVLKHVFSKTGVSRQSELVALLSRMVLH